MRLKNKWFRGLLMLLMGAMPKHSLAQRPFYFDKPITLDSLTRYVHSHSSTRFAFNSSKVKGSKVINLKKGVYSIGLLLQEIRNKTSLYYFRYNGYVIFQDNPPKQKNTTHPVAKRNKPPNTPVRRPQPPDTTHIIAHANPDSLNRVIVVNSPAPVDTVYRKVKDTIGLYLGITANGKDRDARTRNGHDHTIDAGNWQLKQGQLLTGPVPIDSLKDHRWVKDTMPAKTKTINTAISKKEERQIARSNRHSGFANYGQGGSSSNWQFGLHWKVAMPLNGSRYYFTGPNNRNQPWNLFIPGIWLSRHKGQHEILLLVKPAEWALYGANIIRADTSARNYGTDSLPFKVPLHKTINFIKSGGIYAGVQYNYHFNERIVMGAGLGYQTLGQTLGLKQTDTGIGTNGKGFPDTLFTANRDDFTATYLHSWLVMAKLEVAYKLGMVDLGAAVLLPLTSPFSNNSREQKKPLNYQVFIRWRLKGEPESL